MRGKAAPEGLVAEVVGRNSLMLGAPPKGGGQNMLCGLVLKDLSFFSAAASAPVWVVTFVLRTRLLLGLLVRIFGERLKNVHHDFMNSLMNLRRKCTGKKNAHPVPQF